MQAQKQRQQQIPFGDDKLKIGNGNGQKTGNGNSQRTGNGKGKSNDEMRGILRFAQNDTKVWGGAEG
jgi:hypothetical protein